MIIGLTGTNGAGKGTVVEYLKTIGFKHLSVREYLVTELKKENKELIRENMINLANHLRETYSPDYIVKELYESAHRSKQNCIIESIRCPGEVTYLKKQPEFYLLAVDAEQNQRYQRIHNRNSETDKITLEEFIEQEKKEYENKDPFKQNLKQCIKLADINLENNESIENLNKKTKQIISNYLQEK